MKLQHVSVVRATCAVAMTLLMTGCATSSDDQSKYIRDGVQYGERGKTADGKRQGNFRGRWWNYYERGRSYLDGQYYAEAEEDLRIALAKRTKDQRWARTYGLHFVSEYFPNRELGIVLYNQEKYEEAIPYLELSNQQTPSARAAYFLDQARSTLYSKTDSSDPAVTFTTQNVDVPTIDSSVILSARATDDTFIRSIRVGNDPYPIQVSAASVDIEAPVTLGAGTNSITVTVTDIAGKEATYTLDIATDHEGPAISFNRPITLPGTVSGVISDPAGIESLLVGGQTAALASANDGTTTFSVNISREVLSQLPAQRPVLFAAEDKRGNKTNGPVNLVEGDRIAVLDETSSDIVFATQTGSIDMGNGLLAVLKGGKIEALTLAAADTPLTKPEIKVTNAIGGQRYRLEEIVLGMLLSAPSPIERVIINGVEIERLVPGRREQTISRRIPLPEEENQVTIEVIDASGEKETQEFTIVREFTDIHLPGNRLNLAILGSIWAGTAPDLEEDASYITGRLKTDLARQNRFALVSDSDIDAVVEEREIVAAFGDKGSRQALSNELQQAEVLVIGKIHRSFDNIEVVLEAIDPVSSSVIGYADVAGPSTSRAELQALSNDLALRFQQLFPVAQGEIVQTQNRGKLQTTLSQSDGVSKNIRCIVYRRSPEQFHEVTGESLGYNTEIIANGYINEVKSDGSVLSVLSEDKKSEIAIEETDLVITK